MPKQPVKSAARFTKSGGNTFLMFSLFALGLSVAGALGVFGYGEYLKSVDAKKSEALSQARLAVSADAVEGFVRSRDRFEAAGGILDSHVAISNFFDLLESITLVNVRYSGFSFTTLEDGTAEIALSGTARSFNALAAQSGVFSKEKDIRRAIFSGIDVDEKGTVSFVVNAVVDADLLKFAVDESSSGTDAAPTPVVPAATPATTTPAAQQPSAPAATSTKPAAPVTPTQL